MTNPLKILLFYCLLLGSAFTARAQTDSLALNRDTLKPAKKPLLLTFGLDFNIANLAGAYSYDYQGEYNMFGGGAAGWTWVDHKISYDKLLSKTNYKNIKLAVMIANSKVIQAGLSYNFGSVSANIPTPDYNNHGDITYFQHDFVYAGISLTAQYNYYFKQESKMGLYALGGLDVGFYTGTDDLFGPGTPFYLQGRLGLGYNFKKDIMFKAFISEDMLLYHDTETSQVFQRPETTTINLNALYIGIGLAKTFTIVPD